VNEQLSEPARETLDLLAAGMTPSPAQEADAWGRLQTTLRAEARREEWTFSRRAKRGFRYVRGYVRRMWIPLALVTIIALSVGQILGGHLGGDTHIGLAESALERGEYRRAYNLLAEHSRIYSTKSAAEARMGLVVDALCGLKMYDKAEEDLQRYLELNPQSRHAPRIDDLCPMTDADGR
jgi:hypothetical protein